MKNERLPQTENDVKALVKKWFEARGGRSWATPTSRGMGVHGIADRVGVIPVQITQEMVGKHVGLFVAIEAKKPGRRGERLGGATQAQADYLNEVIDCEGIGALVDCRIDLDALDAAFVALRADPEADNPSVAARCRLVSRTSSNG